MEANAGKPGLQTAIMGGQLQKSNIMVTFPTSPKVTK